MSDPLDRLKTALADRYAIEREIGSGGMATVYLARDLKHDRKVAVKVFLPELAAALGTDRFFREIKITANLSHPHILPLLDSGEADGLLYYVMPLVEGDSLRNRLNREKQLAVDEALRITSQVASALSYAHAQHIVHRDIKPENILFQAGEVVVADFGIALAVDSAGGTRLTETGFSLGTPAYMSPEQVSGEQEIDGRSDIYSLACVLYEMLAGDPPFTASNPRAVLAKHMTDPVPPITTVRSSVPRPLAAALTKALGKAPADRFESAKAFAEALFASEVEAEEEKKSIVVLPFENLSPDPDQEYFSDGLTEEVISDLSMVPVLQVISRSSAMTFKGSNKKIPEIAKELNVRYVLEGSVRKAGDSLRITAQLIDATSDIHLWANKYSGTLEDVFDFQEKVSRGIVEALKVRLTAEEDRRLAERPIDNVAAYDAYLQASREIIGGATADALGRAMRLLQKALDMVGPNALVYAGLASTYWQYVNIGLMQEDGIALMDECLDKALALDSEAPEANAIRGMADAAFHGRPQDAVHRFKSALTIRPNEPNALPFLGTMYIYCGKIDAAATVVDRLLRVDPLSWFTHWLKGAVHFYAGRYDFAMEDYRTLYELWPEHFAGQLFYALALTHNGDSKLAIEILNRATAAESAHGYVTMLKYALLGDKERFDRELTPELRKTTARDGDWSYHVAVMHALLGVHEETLRWIEQAASRGMINYPLLAELDPFLDDVRCDERFKTLMARVKQEWEEFEV